jgi:hypothetical protein
VTGLLIYQNRSEYIFNYAGRRCFHDLRVFEQIADGSQELGIVVTVGDSFIQDHFAVKVFVVDDFTFAVQFGSMAFCTERNEDRQGPEIIDVVIDRADPQGTEIGDDHGAVERTCISKGCGEPSKVIEDTKEHDDEAEKKPGSFAQRFSHIFCVVVAVVCLDFFYFFIQLVIDVEDGISWLKNDLYCGLSGVGAHGTLDGHYDFYVVVGIDPAPDNETIDRRKHGYGADIGSDPEMQDADAFISVHPQFTKSAVQIGNLQTLLIMDQSIIPGRHDIGDEFGKGGQGTEKPSVLPIAGTSGRSHREPPG